ncbi:MAG: OmpA family protein [Geobacteraceae bacterium]|nr:OmpA family protein [Geobacteraceae bacterium]
MNKPVCVALATIALIFVNFLPLFAAPAGHGGYAGRGGYAGHGGYAGQGGYAGHGGYGGHGGYYRYGGYGRHGGYYGGGVWFGPGWWSPYYPYYPYYLHYPYYPAPPVVVPRPSYWYYCRDPEGYYPYVKQCPTGWMRVVPSAPPVEQEELCMTVDIQFDTDKAVIKPAYFREVEKVASFMKEHPQVKGTIEGHTDGVGSADYNLRLSQRRAESVVNLLVEKYGVDGSRLTAKGYGLTRPIADNRTKEGRQKNRRTVANFGCVPVDR